jgi:hypothetical protein
VEPTARRARPLSGCQPRGNKYFFPGAGGQKIIDVSHWLGALITSAEIIGTTGITPVRALIDDGAALIPSEKLALCVVTAETEDGEADSGVDAAVSSPVRTSGLHAVSFGDTRAAWASAAEVCAATHVRYLDAPVRRVLSIVPEMYGEIWTAAKGFYKLEPVVADGDEERPRVQVTLATGIPEDVCRAANLGYLDPASVDVAAFAADPDTLVVQRAGEMLYGLDQGVGKPPTSG